MTVSPTSPRRRRGLLLVAMLVATPALAACTNDGQSATDPASTSSAAPNPASTSAAASQTPTDTSPSPSSDGATTVAAPVYFVGDTPQGPRLFREFQQVGADDQVNEALARSAAGEATDPDYRSLLPAGAPTVTSVDDTIEIALPNASWATRPASMSARQAKLAVQQLVYTAQGVLQRRSTVGFTVDGAGSSILGLDAEGGFKAAKDLNVLGLVNLTNPQQGAAVSGTFTADGVASSFEATVPWELRSADGTVVKKGFATAEGWMDKLYPFSTEVDVSDVPPGDYTFVAMTDDPSDGEGTGPTEDTKAITVQ